jgi:phosphoglycolate phosphatase-like HAD superfamily hydrolase
VIFRQFLKEMLEQLRAADFELILFSSQPKDYTVELANHFTSEKLVKELQQQ